MIRALLCHYIAPFEEDDEYEYEYEDASPYASKPFTTSPCTSVSR